MTYYEQLIKQIGRSMNDHPHSTVVMDYESRKVVAAGVSPKRLSRKIRDKRPEKSISIVFQKPKENAVWILAKSDFR